MQRRHESTGRAGHDDFNIQPLIEEAYASLFLEDSMERKEALDAEKLYCRCKWGNCPLCMDSMSPCPVVELCNKPCRDIGLEDWERWVRSASGGWIRI
jgi:hypothetical protein